MTYFYDNCVPKYGINKPGQTKGYGTYIMPNGTLLDGNGYSSVAHGGIFIMPFFQSYMHPHENTIRHDHKEVRLERLIRWRESLLNTNYGLNPNEQQMRLHLYDYFINIYKSNKSIWDCENGRFDFSEVTVIPNNEENWIGRDVTLKSVLVQACNYDSIESQGYRIITTSKFNIYETFYDYILHDYKIFQIPKKVYDKNLQKYIELKQSIWFMSDKELRLKAELESICKHVPLEERNQYCINKSKIKMNLKTNIKYIS